MVSWQTNEFHKVKGKVINFDVERGDRDVGDLKLVTICRRW